MRALSPTRPRAVHADFQFRVSRSVSAVGVVDLYGRSLHPEPSSSSAETRRTPSRLARSRSSCGSRARTPTAPRPPHRGCARAIRSAGRGRRGRSAASASGRAGLSFKFCIQPRGFSVSASIVLSTCFERTLDSSYEVAHTSQTPNAGGTDRQRCSSTARRDEVEDCRGGAYDLEGQGVCRRERA